MGAGRGTRRGKGKREEEGEGGGLIEMMGQRRKEGKEGWKRRKE